MAKSTARVDLAQELMKYFLEPSEYAQFVNATGTAYVVPGATSLIKTSISRNPILVPTAPGLKKVEFDRYLSAAGTALWANTWQEVKAA